MSDITFRNVEKPDLPVIRDIYNHYLRTTTATFRVEEMTTEKLKDFIFLHHQKYGAFLIHSRGELAGFCFLTRFKNAEGYNRTAEIGIYLKPEFTRRGLGATVVKYLQEVARKSGIKMLMASICGENTASLKLFRKLAYDECGHFKHVGEKFGRTLDVVFFQRSLER